MKPASPEVPAGRLAPSSPSPLVAAVQTLPPLRADERHVGRTRRRTARGQQRVVARWLRDLSRTP
jgi:hypothetical protein